MKLDFDPEVATAALCRADKSLAKVIRKAGACTLRPEALHSPFRALLRAIVYQQLSGKAAATIYGRVEALVPRGRVLKPQAILDLPDESLRAAGMSWAKILAVKDLAAKTIDGTVPSLARLNKMDDGEIITRLVQVRGIGQWSVEMLLMFRLGRPDVLPATDLGVRQGFMHTYGHKEMPTPRAILEYGDLWRPWRSIASWYMWRAVDLHRKANKK